MLMAPLHFIICATSLCQDKVDEHVAKETIPPETSESPYPWFKDPCFWTFFFSSTCFFMGQGTAVSMAKPSFCGQWAILLFILGCVFDHCHAGRSNHGPV